MGLKHSEGHNEVNSVSALDGVFRKSSFSGGSGCVEVARFTDGRVQVRDTKDPDQTTLSFNKKEWQAFLAGVHNNEFSI
jgi:hypothetical protein